jgi:hypothetical protein
MKYILGAINKCNGVTNTKNDEDEIDLVAQAKARMIKFLNNYTTYL